MTEDGLQPDTFFFAHRGGRCDPGELAQALARYEALPTMHDYWSDDAPQSLLIEEVEAIWSAIAERDDWTPLHQKVAAIRRMGTAHGPKPRPAGHLFACSSDTN
jgi:hypothetical protein